MLSPHTAREQSQIRPPSRSLRRTRGYPSDPDPVYAGCCIEGNDWAATVGFNNSQGPLDVDYNQVISASGGR